MWSAPRWPNFSYAELACKDEACTPLPMNDAVAHFLDKLQALRTECNFPFIISSAYRTPEHNLRVSSTGRNGPHTTGRAVDVQACGEQAWLIVTLAAQYGMTGIGVNQTGDHATRIIHLDDLSADKYPRPRVWSY